MPRSQEKREILRLLGVQIREIRVSKGLSQQELASACDLEKSNMSRLEAGNTNPTFLTLHKISKALNVPVKELSNFNY